MPVLVPYVPGDVVYPQFDLRQTMPISAALNIVKGHVYKVNSTGYIIVVTASSGIVDLTSGLFQAAVDSTAVTGEAAGDRRVQFIVPPSFMVMYAIAGLEPGNRVQLDATTTVVDPDKVKAAASNPWNVGTFGRIYRILAKDANEVTKLVTENNDLVVIRVGEA